MGLPHNRDKTETIRRCLALTCLGPWRHIGYGIDHVVGVDLECVLMWKPVPLCCLALAAACGNPTEIIVFADTNLGVPCDVDRLQVEVIGADAADAVSKDFPLDGDVVPSWTLVKSGGGDAITVRATAWRGDVVRAKAVANTSFRAYTTQSLSVVLTDDCTDANPCDLSQFVQTRLVEPVASSRAVCVPPQPCDGLALYDDCNLTSGGVGACQTEGDGLSCAPRPPPYLIVTESVDNYTFTDVSLVADLTDACDNGGFAEYEEFSGVARNDSVFAVTNPAFVAALETFDFQFYNEPIRRLWLADDGFMTFGENAVEATLDRVTNTEGLPSLGGPRFGVAAMWDNLEFRANTRLCSVIIGADTPETAVLWTTWRNICLAPACPTTDNFEFSVGLEAFTNRVIVGFETATSVAEPDRAAGALAVVGVADNFTTPGCDADEEVNGLCTDGTPAGYTHAHNRELVEGGLAGKKWRFTPVLQRTARCEDPFTRASIACPDECQLEDGTRLPCAP
jgi:hypothetical protein